jgi:iron complex outermembrane receptor protein
MPTPTHARLHAPRLALTALALACAAAVQAQSPAPQRVEVTGSSIKRIDAESALPVQVIGREEIERAGLTTAAELVARIAAASNGLTDGVSIGTGGFRDQMGMNSANLRGIGTSSTLVLLNGRRMANFASPGDDTGVDLNNIPAAAVERVEVLLDGASAIYGTDAIGGVINFITRKDWRGAELSARVAGTHEGGAGKRTASAGAGLGSLDKDGYNVFAVLDLQKTDALRTSQRAFINDLKIPERLPHLLSSAPSPGNIRLSGDQRDYLQSVGYTINGKPIVNRTINLSAPNCNPPHSLYLPDGIGGEDACTYDYMRDLELYPRTEKTGLLGRGVLQLGRDHQLYAEVSYSRAKSWYAGTSNRVDGDLDVSMIPALAATGLGDALPDDRTITVRTRLLEAGMRTSQITSTGSRIVTGLTGTLAGWEYDLGLNHSVNTVSDRDAHGYLLYDKTMEGIASGLINPFGESSAAGRAYLDSIQVNEEVRRARGTMDSIDLKGNRPVARLEGGDLMLALGAEWRRERSRSNPSELLLSDNILGDPTPGDGVTTDGSRRVGAVFAELVAPVTRSLELQFALRHDRYQVVGSTTNPKVGVRWQPAASVLVRASAGTGFRAPSLADMVRPATTGSSATLPDPVCMAENDNDLGYCADIWETRTYSNPKLKPERSRQLSLGIVAQPTRQASFSVDYWAISKRDLISTLGDDVILGNLAKYETLVHRYNEDEGLPGCDYDPDDSTICFIELRKENRGRQKASGVDLAAELKGLKTDWGSFGVRLTGTLALVSKQQTGNGDPYVSNLGRFVTDGVVQRWRHRLSVDWERGPWTLTLSNSYIGSYEDQNSAIDTNSGTVVAPNRVKAYSLWDLSGSWSPTRQLTLRAGIQNLADTAPPYSNQAYFFISGYDPSYTDPRGRTYYMSAQYRF